MHKSITFFKLSSFSYQTGRSCSPFIPCHRLHKLDHVITIWPVARRVTCRRRGKGLGRKYRRNSIHKQLSINSFENWQTDRLTMQFSAISHGLYRKSKTKWNRWNAITVPVKEMRKKLNFGQRRRRNWHTKAGNWIQGCATAKNSIRHKEWRIGRFYYYDFGLTKRPPEKKVEEEKVRGSIEIIRCADK